MPNNEQYTPNPEIAYYNYLKNLMPQDNEINVLQSQNPRKQINPWESNLDPSGMVDDPNYRINEQLRQLSNPPDTSGLVDTSDDLMNLADPAQLGMNLVGKGLKAVGKGIASHIPEAIGSSAIPMMPGLIKYAGKEFPNAFVYRGVGRRGGGSGNHYTLDLLDRAIQNPDRVVGNMEQPASINFENNVGKFTPNGIYFNADFDKNIKAAAPWDMYSTKGEDVPFVLGSGRPMPQTTQEKYDAAYDKIRERIPDNRHKEVFDALFSSDNPELTNVKQNWQKYNVPEIWSGLGGGKPYIQDDPEQIIPRKLRSELFNDAHALGDFNPNPSEGMLYHLLLNEQGVFHGELPSWLQPIIDKGAAQISPAKSEGASIIRLVDPAQEKLDKVWRTAARRRRESGATMANAWDAGGGIETPPPILDPQTQSLQDLFNMQRDRVSNYTGHHQTGIHNEVIHRFPGIDEGQKTTQDDIMSQIAGVGIDPTNPTNSLVEFAKKYDLPYFSSHLTEVLK